MGQPEYYAIIKSNFSFLIDKYIDKDPDFQQS